MKRKPTKSGPRITTRTEIAQPFCSPRTKLDELKKGEACVGEDYKHPSAHLRVLYMTNASHILYSLALKISGQSLLEGFSIQKKTYSRSHGELFEASLKSVKGLGWKLVSQDKAAGTIKAETGMSLRSWGEKISVHVAEELGGNTVSVTSGVSSQIFGWGKDAENEDAFHRELKKLVSR